MKILVIKLSSLGDVLHTLPAIKAIKTKTPESEISWLINKNLAPIAEMVPYVDKVIPFDRDIWKQKGNLGKKLQQLRALRNTLKSYKFDISLDFQGLFRSGFFSIISGAPIRWGMDNSREGAFLFHNRICSVKEKQLHAIKEYMTLAQSFLQSNTPLPIDFELPPSQEEIEKLSQIGLPSSPYVLLFPEARWDSKIWPLDYFKKLALKIRQDYKLPVVIGGTGKNIEEWTPLEKADPNIKNLSGKTNLSQLINLIRKAKIVFCNDSGPMHIASALNKKQIAFIGPTKEGKTGPFQNAIILKEKLSCAPCLKRICPRKEALKECMTLISPEKAIEAAKPFLTKENTHE